MSKSYIIRVNGKPIEVSSEVYDTYMKMKEKQDIFQKI